MPAAQHCRELRNRTLVIEDQSEGVVDRETGFHSRCLMALALWRGTVGWGRKSQAPPFFGPAHSTQIVCDCKTGSVDARENSGQ